MNQPSKRSSAIGQVLATNLTNALNVAGPAAEHDLPGRYSLEALRRNTKLARSTIRKLRQGGAGNTSNPDLKTLCKVADELCIPVAFLLMGRQEWKTLMAAFHATLQADHRIAADQLEKQHLLHKPEAGLRVLSALKVYPLEPLQIASEQDGELRAARARESDAFRKATLVTTALMQAAEWDMSSLKQLTLLAACHANADKPNFQ